MTLGDEVINSSKTRDEALAKLWEKRKTSDGGDPELFGKLEQAELLVKQVPIINVTSALELSVSEWSKVADKINTLLKQKVFLEVKSDPSLIAGCLVIWQGKIFDYSLRATMSAKKKEFKELVHAGLT